MDSLLTTALLGLFVSVVAGTDPLVVSTTLGKVRGQLAKTRGGRQYTQFLGIPYAKSPTGSLRFKSPVSPDPWVSVVNATKECSDCIQQYVPIEALRTIVSGSEDCLCVNVFTPSVFAINYPVIVWIHGGSYVGGSGSPTLYGGDLLLDQDVVLVTLNYRLGVMGFLSTADAVIPGNFGLKDQALALKWVKRNIENFGGDPNSITLMGESAGSVSVSLHQRSPLSNGLFHKAIQESGSFLNPWSMVSPKVLKGRAGVLGKAMGCPSGDSVDLLKCLQNAPAREIVNTTHTFLVWDIDPLVTWGPTIEERSVKDAFLTIDPRRSLPTPTIPLLIGINAAEGGTKTTTMVGSMPEQKFARWNKEFFTLTPISLMINGSKLDNLDTLRAIRRFYFGSETLPITPDMLQQITHLYSDFWIDFGVLDEVESRSGSAFLYYFNYNKTVSACPVILLGTLTPYVGACHYDELLNFFPIQGLAAKHNESDPDYLLSVKMVKLWTNFAKTSIPSTNEIIWNPVKSKALEYLEISNRGISMKSNLLAERRQFWKSITAKGGNK